MEIKEITNKEVWEGFLVQCHQKTFLDSWYWGDFNEKEGNRIWRFGIYEDNNLSALFLLIKVEAKRGVFLFIPHGPVIKPSVSDKQRLEILEALVIKVKELAKEDNADFIRIAPIMERNERNNNMFRDLKFKEAPLHIHPETTWELDITKNEDDILKGMRKTTRYLIKQAEKNQDIEITKSQNIEDLKIFNEIYRETAKRHKFVPYSLGYLENEFNSFKEQNHIIIFLGKYKEKIVSSAVVIFWQNTAFYHQGASLEKYNKIPVSYLLQWNAIKEAKNRGCGIYNFWGIAPDMEKKDMVRSRHPWAGLSLFKMGFGGYKKEYVKTQDFPVSSKYYLIYIFEKLRKLKRHL
ncbi:MAG: peptidoglycan bridge formation glycyltransferase FemA/FemB family protein [Candidatus Pacebacteria bacterium]|nr:peptidoglycan bridge formation glycyltransferase FemA/FemB family protein [Candidatus Paceibacterota bacterium]